MVVPVLKAKSPPPPLQADEQPDTFKIIGWKVFRPGYLKGKLYTRADSERAVQNFNYLSAGEKPFIKAKAKLGHDSTQRILKSVGVANVGRITSCTFDATDGGFFIDIHNIPTTILDVKGEVYNFKKAFDNGNYDDCSVELEPSLPDPTDPSKTVEGPILIAVSFLGEEQPAVKGLDEPVTTFSDVSRAIPSEYSDHRSGSKTVIVFSEVDPMPPRADLLAQLQANGIDTSDASIAAMTDEQLFSLCKQFTGEAFTSKMKAKFAAPPATPPADDKKTLSDDDQKKDEMSDDDQKKDEMSKKFAAFMDDCTKRMGAVESAVQDVQKLKPDIQASAKFSQNYEEQIKAERLRVVTSHVDAAIKGGRLMPSDKKIFVTAGLAAETAVKFSEGDNKGKTEFEVWLAELENRPASYMFSDVIDDNAKSSDELDDSDRRILAHSRKGRKVLSELEAQASK